ncbi:hypothetical protein QBC40DRAFT_278367 [Triangularia verruculosa]|uniref:PPPDE domain-containing protein n=1 Tax=Triangularia verruculosa TaxID=2587418 RepID=A0AAN6XMV5_9PEZI|nr:hypothetical protein QBC40DRAFT_278367 [Triangularia verruculosa]
MSRRSHSSTSSRSAEAPRPSSRESASSRGSLRPSSRESALRPSSRDSEGSRHSSSSRGSAGVPRPTSRDSNGSHRSSSSRDSPRPAFSSNSSSSVSIDYNRPRPLYRIGWGGNTTGHQGLFLPDYDGSPVGTLYHINIQNGTSSGTGSRQGYEVRADGFTMSSSNARSAFQIHGAMVTNNMVRRATQSVFDNGGDYNMFINNCQHFCLEAIIYMNRMWPEHVGPEAIAHLQTDRPSTMVAMTTMMGRNRSNPQQPPPPAPGPSSRSSRDRFSIN